MEVATRYRPGETDLLVGGDFFDVFRLGPNAWGIVVGDVCGKGAGAASLTALTRYTVRAAAVHHALPSAVLEEVNTGLVADTSPEGDDRFCTVVFARLELDVCGAWVTLANAGHPRPTVVRRAGWIDIRGQAGTPVGMFDRAVVTDDRVGLGPGDALVICTDGITEARNRNGEMFGDEALPTALLECAGATAEVIADKVLTGAAGFAGTSPRDDVAILVVRVPEDAKEDSLTRLSAATGVPADQLDLPGYPVGDPHGGLWHQRPLAPREARKRLAAEASSVPATRQFLVGVLRSWRMPEMVEGDVELLTSELATNAVRYADSAFTVIVRYDGEVVRVEVGDGSRSLPRLRSPELDDATGRGLVLVEALASAWGVIPTVEGKRVWFEVAATAGERRVDRLTDSSS
jgi:anti-sigma regulatory factor (Ser/Thr protein kinase)